MTNLARSSNGGDTFAKQRAIKIFVQVTEKHEEKSTFYMCSVNAVRSFMSADPKFW